MTIQTGINIGLIICVVVLTIITIQISTVLFRANKRWKEIPRVIDDALSDFLSELIREYNLEDSLSNYEVEQMIDSLMENHRREVEEELSDIDNIREGLNIAGMNLSQAIKTEHEISGTIIKFAKELEDL